MKKLRIYLDTSVIGGCFDDEFKVASLKLMEEIKSGVKVGVISTITVKEIEVAPQHVQNLYLELEPFLLKLDLVDEINELVKLYLASKVISEKYINDAAHIAYSTVYQVDILASWNFKHIVNYNKIIQFNSINIKNGYKPLQIYSPMEIITNE